MQPLVVALKTTLRDEFSEFLRKASLGAVSETSTSKILRLNFERAAAVTKVTKSAASEGNCRESFARMSWAA